MQRTHLNTFLWGLLLLVAGVAGLLYNFGVFADYEQLAAYIAAGLLAFAGLSFLVLLVFRREQWLFVIPGVSLLGLGSIVYLTTLESIQAVWLAALFLASMAAGFLILFLSNRHERWWALLQAGTIAVIALVGLGVGVPEESQHILGSALFGGFALSFLLLFLFGGDFRRFLWALIMAGVLMIFSLTLLTNGVTSLTAATLLRLWPVLFILLGVFFFFRLLTGRASPRPAAVRTVPAETLEQRETTAAPFVEMAPVGSDAPIVTRPGQEAKPSAPAVPSSTLPASLRSPDMSDPSAALDALLEASQRDAAR